MRAIFVILACVLMTACATQNECVCPAQDSVFLLESGFPVQVPEGFFDDTDNFWNQEEWGKAVEEYRSTHGI